MMMTRMLRRLRVMKLKVNNYCVSDLRMIIARQETLNDGEVQEKEEHVHVPVTTNERERSRERIQRAAARRRRHSRRGRTMRSTARGRSSQMLSLREIDEANGWTYVPRERP
ncbi:hypothetical protein HW555_011625 [Spodoptera exigua]|uniref:Uncharacterized protein n=1 Tax=Spodoptera exigua TaxID=7107 RepID=A0A835G876_SPOEX|nr:hypothetical protein HW555_011625 [Spodoptera exigua]